MTLSRKDIKKLWTASGNQCAFPDCDQQLIDFDRNSVIGEMCHIHAQKPGGSRYDADMGTDERESYSNRILLCRNHHKLVDDSPDEFPAKVLERWKQEHEEQPPQVPKLPPELLNDLAHEFNPSNLLVHVGEGDIECLRDVLDWEPHEEFPEEMDNGDHAILVTFDDLKMLHSHLSALYRPVNGIPAYKHNQEWTEYEIIQVTFTITQITQLAIQYFQVEGNRRKRNFDNNIQ
ncbi:HNH endonuclease [Natrarchaeobius sp. A-rgal3]|uniref:HNH endonuclease n=1 Tax=Natrarchaeobius versutus TaxID=1679078 RepID=UPI0035107D8A